MQCPTKYKVRYIYIIYIFKHLSWEILVPFIYIITQMNDTVISRNILF